MVAGHGTHSRAFAGCRAGRLRRPLQARSTARRPHRRRAPAHRGPPADERVHARGGALLGDGDRATPPRALRGVGRARHRVLAPDAASLPRERLPPARLRLLRVPDHPEHDPRLRRPEPAGWRRAARQRASRPHPRDRRDRLGEDDDPRGHARPHQPDAPPPHRHGRGPDRDPASGPRLHREPAGGRARHRELRAGDPPRPPSGPGRHPHRRAARRRVRPGRPPGLGVRAISSSRRCTRSMPPRHWAGSSSSSRPRSTSRSARSSPGRCAASSASACSRRRTAGAFPRSR